MNSGVKYAPKRLFVVQLNSVQTLESEWGLLEKKYISWNLRELKPAFHICVDIKRAVNI